MASLKGKVVVITGASAGIGAASAVKFAKHGARLVLHGRNESNLNQVVEQCVAEGITADDVVTALGDLADDSTVDNIIKTALDKFGTIHILFNNAGFASSKDGPLSVSGCVESFDEMYQIILKVPYLLVQGFVAELIKNKGVIINCSSGYSKLADPTVTAYATMKAGLDHFTKILSIELAMKGVRVNSINPGFVRTSIARTYGDAAEAFWDSGCSVTPLEQKLSTPDDIASVVTFLASEEASSITGQNIVCDRGATLTSRIVDFTLYK